MAMTTFRGLCLLSFFGTMGVLMLFLACALPQYNNWYPMFVIFTYVLAPIPMAIANRNEDSFSTANGVAKEIGLFCTSALVVSGFAIPLVLLHNHKIEDGACALVMAGNAVVFLTTLAYYVIFREDGWSASWV
eukprot:m.113481 g.113481  ORF g.113481 m.113481 type:complete len:133 (+) comp16004_c0_seq3:84-482(+)